MKADISRKLHEVFGEIGDIAYCLLFEGTKVYDRLNGVLRDLSQEPGSETGKK